MKRPVLPNVTFDLYGTLCVNSQGILVDNVNYKDKFLEKQPIIGFKTLTYTEEDYYGWTYEKEYLVYTINYKGNDD